MFLQVLSLLAGAVEMSDETAAQSLLLTLGLTREPPSLAALGKVLRAFLFGVPFDNIYKLLSLDGPEEERIPAVETYVEFFERYGAGGTCLTNNPYFCKLLEFLGYDAWVCGADMGEKRNVHTCVHVKLDGNVYHTDVGYGGRMLEPVDIEELPAEFELGPRRYTLERGADSRVRVSEWDGEEVVHGYIVNLGPITAEDFRGCADDSFRPESNFLNMIRIVKQTPSSILAIANRHLTVITADGKTSRDFADLADLETYVSNELDISSAPLHRAVEVLARHKGKRVFGG